MLFFVLLFIVTHFVYARKDYANFFYYYFQMVLQRKHARMYAKKVMLRFFLTLLTDLDISHTYSKYINSFHEQCTSDINSSV